MSGARVRRDMEVLRLSIPKQRARSAITGRWIKAATARRWPKFTILERRRKVPACDSAISYAAQAPDTPGELPTPAALVLTCELRSGHSGPHRSGSCTWPKVS